MRCFLCPGDFCGHWVKIEPGCRLPVDEQIVLITYKVWTSSIRNPQFTVREANYKDSAEASYRKFTVNRGDLDYTTLKVEEVFAWAPMPAPFVDSTIEEP